PTKVNVPFGRGPCAILRVTAAWLAVINNMSTAPRPYNLPSSISASNGGLVHLGSSTGTTSIWPKSVNGSACGSEPSTVNATDTRPGCGSNFCTFTSVPSKNFSNVAAFRYSSPESAVKSFTHALRISSCSKSKVSSERLITCHCSAAMPCRQRPWLFLVCHWAVDGPPGTEITLQ